MTKVKGSNIRLAHEFALRAGGAAAWSDVLLRLAPSDRLTVAGVIAVGWYDLSLQHRVFDALDAAVSRPDFDAVAELAGFIAEHDLTKVHRLFLRLRSPHVVLEKAGEYWRRFYDAGAWSVTRTTAKSASGELTGIEETSPVFCRFLEHYIKRMFELAGVTGMTCAHTRCRCRNATSCRFDGSWLEP